MDPTTRTAHSPGPTGASRARRMRTALRPPATVVAVAVLALTLLGAPASAETRLIQDRTGDGSGGTGGGPGRFGDIARVRVAHAPRFVWISVRPPVHGASADFYDFWIDTDGRDPGPEFVATVSAEVPRPTRIQHTTGWGRWGAEGCRVRVLDAPGTDAVVRLRFRRACLRTDGVVPHRIRVAVHTAMEYGGADWAPGRRKLSRWIQAG